MTYELLTIPRLARAGAAALWLSLTASGQTLVDLQTQSRNVDFSGAAATRPLKTGQVLPATCRTGEMFFKTNASSGENLHGCTATNVWTKMAAGSGVAGGGVTGTAALSDCKVAAEGSSATVSAPCRLSIGGIVHELTGDATATLSGVSTSGAVYFYWDRTGKLVADENTGATLTCTNCAARSEGTFPPGAFPIATATFAANSFASGVLTDLRAFLSNKSVYCGTGLTCTEDALTGELTIAADTTTALLAKSVHQSGQALRCVSAAASPAHGCTMSPALVAYAAGMVVEFVGSAAGISGPTTLNIDGLGARPVKRADGSRDPGINELAAGQQIPLRYDGTVFRLPAWGTVSRSVTASPGGCSAAGGFSNGVNITGISGSAITSAACSSQGGTGSPLRPFFEFSPVADQYFGYQWVLPEKVTVAAGVSVMIGWSSSSTDTATNVRHGVSVLCVQAGGDAIPASAAWSPARTGDGGPAATANGRKTLTIDVPGSDFGACGAGDLAIFRIGRLGSDAADTSMSNSLILDWRMAWKEAM